ncbi:hypothetical protein TanjilG_28162 [Lupinus angustifolius]|uniref:Amino acid transporter transmembrane domain-containing protein n=1 Tax=Lupinus angustifolius TaxID=3871 RepID=A0A4P1REI7_LUPAN|nr:hypothetical protein TanjilG_28162 [Lupinus angustifolius]
MNSRSYTMTMEDNKTHNNPKQLKDEESPLLLHGSSNINNNVAEASSSFTGSVFNLSTTVIGAGIMALPAAMKVLGLPIGIGAIIFLAFLTNTSLEILMRFSRVGKAGTYGDVLSGTSSNGTHHFGVLEGWFGECWWTGRTFVLLMTTLLVFAPLGFFKRIDSLRYTSAIAVALAIVFLVITAGITFVKFFNGSILSPRLFPNITGIASIWNLFTAVPVLVTAFVCHYNLHMISNELGDTSLIQPVVRVSLVLCSSIYILTALFGLLLFGESTLDDVLANFDTDLGIPYSSLLNDIVRISYAVHLMLVFPVIFFSLRFNFNDLFFPSASSSDLDKRVFVLITTGLVSLLYVAANFVPSIWIAFQFTGATATVCLGFVFPAAIALRDPHGIATKNDKIISIVMIFLAVFSNVVAIYSNIDSLFRKAS